MIVVEYMTALNMALKMSTEIAARERKVWDIQKDFICELEAGSFYVDDPEISGQPEAGSGQLRACPFCGGEANVKMWCETDTPYLVMCEACGASVKDYTTEAEAVKAWNHRADDHFRDAAEKVNSGQMPAAGGQQKGKWLWDEEEDRCYCSECGEEDDKNIDGVYMMHDFCPNCGADMRGE